ncbi:gem-associated protein 5 isoform X2 [Thrips palmi]|uniref:Gem-associated protein 5 isoform X2 n=1 Tax=Thrips palmi TaxID=161013 RepID=A0A6P9ADE3_THRPL|nr:gem-associated protein 5 isoform X2 [Thrips palmi]
MEKCSLVGSPNWYLSQAFDCSWNQKVAYGSLSSLVIFEPSQSLNPSTLHLAHSFRILSVSFPPEGFGNKLLSTSETGEAFVWDLDLRKVVLAYRSPQKCATYGNWSQANGNLIVCVDESGNLIQWQVESNVFRVKSFKEHSFVVVACCPHDQNIVATGTKQVSGKEYILHQMRGHDSEVVSLAWCPVAENIINPKGNNDSKLLASAAKEKRIFFWRAGQDGLYEVYADVPSAPRITGVRAWTCVCWYEPHLLLVSTTAGEVLSLNVANIKNKKVSDKTPKWETFSLGHNRGHVVVKSSPWPATKEASGDDWRLKETVPRWVWTFGSDRVVHGKSSDVQLSPIKLNTTGGAVNAMTISSIDGTSLAIGGADKSIRVVNLSEPQLKTIQTYNQKVSGKVMSLAWHPSKDGWLAYGTSDGRIGVQYTCAIKPPLLFRPFSKDSIYAMEWAPSLATIKSSIAAMKSPEDGPDLAPSNYVLYAVGGGKLAAMDPNFPDQIYDEPFKSILKTVLKPESLKIKHKIVSLTDLAWKPDYSMLALGDETGSVHMLHLNSKEELHLVSSFKVFAKLIQDLAWHPQCCSSDVTEVSPHANWLACASNEDSIHIVDTSPILDALQSMEELSVPISNLPRVATLKGHKLRVSKLAWSPHEAGRLLSVSYDQCAQVWDVINKQPISCFTGHSAPLFCCLWSPFNPSLGITAGQEGLICIWNTEEQEAKLPVEKIKDASKNFLEGAKEAQCHATENDTSNGDGSSKKVMSKKREKATLPLSGPEVHKEDSNLAILKCLLHPPEAGNIHLDLNGEGDLKKMPVHYAFFGDQSLVEQYLLAEESAVSKENGFTINVWRGSTKDSLTEAIQAKTLSSYLVSIAPTVSHKLWVEACAAYAEQLKEANEFSKAAVYLLAIHKVEEAIRLLAEQGKYRHAMAVARCRLLPDHPLLKSLLNDWALNSMSDGRQCLAAVCFGSGGEWSQAAQALAFKKCPKRLLLAAEIMKLKTSDQQTGKYYALECFNLSLAQSDWTTAQSVLGLYPSLNHLALRLFIHEAICTSQDTLSPGDWLQKSCCTESPADADEAVYVSISLPKEKVAALQQELVDETTVTSEVAAWLAASSKVTLAFLAAPSLFPKIKHKFVPDIDGEDKIKAYRYLIQAMSVLNDMNITALLKANSVPILLKFCMWLAPAGPFKAGSIFSSSQVSLQASLRAYLAAGVLLWLSKCDSLEESVRSLGLETIDIVKSDIFSPEALNWFKNKFQLDVLLKSPKIELSSPRDESSSIGIGVGVTDGNDVTSDKMALLSIDEHSEKLPKAKDENNSSSENGIRPMTEVEKLKIAVQEFVDAREMVPNPYLSYSQLSQYLNSAQADLVDKYSVYWKHVTSTI